MRRARSLARRRSAAPAEPRRGRLPSRLGQGFARSVAGRKLSYRWAYPGYAVSLLCRAVDATWAIEWEGEPAPAAAPDATVTYVWHVGLNSGRARTASLCSSTAGRSSRSTRPAATENREWTVDGQDGARLRS